MVLRMIDRWDIGNNQHQRILDDSAQEVGKTRSVPLAGGF